MISQEEYELLKKCDDKFKWVARDKNTELWVYTKKPYKGMYRWDSVGNINLLPRRSKYLFQLIQWDDEEPYCISDLIKKYEERGDIGYTSEEYAEYLSKFNEKLLTESEEEMKKDKKWLKDEVARIYDTRDYWSVDDLRDEILDLINELDEPEVLSKQEDMLNRKKPAIPKFVANYLYSARGDVSLMRVMELANTRYELPKWKKEYDWISENHETFARAWLDGFTVKKEQLFYVYLGDGHFLVSEDDLKEPHAKIRHQEDRGFLNYNTTFTEQEIKDYDERYLAFKEQVEEAQNENP